MERSQNPRAALDYPALDDALWIIWSGNEYRWPDAQRETSYLTDKRKNILHGFALFSRNYEDAATFETEASACAWLAENEAKRPHPYNVTVSTVAALKCARGFVEGGK